MQMSDDVEARFAAVRVSCQQGPHPVSFGTVHTSSCARETNQSAVRMSLKSACWEGISDVFVVKGDNTENCFSSQSSKKSSVPASPANRCRSSEKAKSSWVRCW